MAVLRLGLPPRGPRFAGAAALLGAAGVVAAVALSGTAVGGSATGTVLTTFATHGQYSWTVPADVTSVTFDVFGAAGGDVANGSTLLAAGGRGGEARGGLDVSAGEIFMVDVGGRGADNSGTTAGGGGWNGGGAGNGGGGSVWGGAGGGGASDVRIGGTGNPCASHGGCTLVDRFVVGGGGGGAGGVVTTQAPNNGGAGGGVNGSFGGPPPGYAGYGQQEGGGLSGGAFGVGGSVAGNLHSLGSGGGGGGWFGGGACCGSGGGGGSGFVAHLAHHRSFPGGSQGGDGLVVISAP